MIIAFTGKAQVGKSTAFESLRANSGGTPVALAKFAEPLYKIQEAIYRIVLPVYQRPPEFVKDRTLLQWIGTNWGRNTIGENVWIDLWKARVAQFQSHDAGLIVAVDDCRFLNEAQAIHELGGVIVGLTSNRTADIGGIANHASEAGLPPEYIDYECANNGTLEEYQTALKELFEKIKAEYVKVVPLEPVVEDDGEFMTEVCIQTKPPAVDVVETAVATELTLDESDFLPET